MPSSSAKKPAKKTEGKKGTATPARVLLEVLDKEQNEADMNSKGHVSSQRVAKTSGR